MGAVVVSVPSGVTTRVSVARVAGTKAVAAYSDAALTSSISLPANITNATTFYLEDDAYVFTLSIGGVDAGSRTVNLYGDQAVGISASLDEADTNAILAEYWDASVGRRQFTWDTVNQRYQMIYGDTGWRDLSSTVTWDASQTTGTGLLLLRRTTNHVAVRLEWTSSGTAFSGRRDVFATGGMPSGFRPSSNQEWAVCLSDPAGTVTVGGAMIRNDGKIQSSFAAAQLSKQIEVSALYATTEAWPSSLPGTASGSIPNN